MNILPEIIIGLFLILIPFAVSFKIRTSRAASKYVEQKGFLPEFLQKKIFKWGIVIIFILLIIDLIYKFKK